MSLECTLVVSFEGTILYASALAPSIFARSSQELLGASVYSLMPERIRGGQAALWSMAKGPSEPMQLDALGLRNGQEFPMNLEIALVDMQDTGSSTGQTYCVNIVDRTTDASQSKQAQKMEALGLLASGVAHDFNNALTTIMGIAQGVKDDLPVGDPLAGDLKELLSAAISAGELPRQLLSFAKHRHRDSTIIELNRSIGEIEKLLRRILPPTIQLEVASTSAKLPVHFAPGDLHHILINLATNAEDAMPEGGRIELKLDRCTVQEPGAFVPKGEYATLALRDTGTGIAKASLSKVFDPFFSTKGSKGTGLGLSTCLGLARNSGGGLAVESVVGEGTTFTLYMPISTTDAVQPQTTTEGTRIRKHKGVALIVEDEAAIQNYIKRTVVKSGLTTLVASSAEEALRLAQSLVVPPELLVSDIALPGESGTELAIKLHQSFPDLKILLTSGRVDGLGQQVDSLETDTVFLPKPFTAKQLRKHIEQLMKPASKRLEGTILLIEPVAEAAQEACETFSDLGLTTVAIANADEAQQYLRSIDLVPSLILLSLSLPDNAALEVLSSVRDRLLTAEIPIVLLESENEKFQFECGNHTSVLRLPVTDEKLSRALERVGLTLS